MTKKGGFGQILWIGRVKKFANKNKVYGVQFMKSNETYHDGVYNGIEYFNGASKHCYIIRYCQIAKNFGNKISITIDGASDRASVCSSCEAHQMDRLLRTAKYAVEVGDTTAMLRFEREMSGHYGIQLDKAHMPKLVKTRWLSMYSMMSKTNSYFES